jgi:hypothetical protein
VRPFRIKIFVAISYLLCFRKPASFTEFPLNNSPSPRYGVVTTIAGKALSGCLESDTSATSIFFMSSKQEELLQQKIADLPFTENLKQILHFQKLATLQDVLNIETYNWHKKFPGFTYHHQHEIVSYLQQNDLTEFLKED